MSDQLQSPLRYTRRSVRFAQRLLATATVSAAVLAMGSTGQVEATATFIPTSITLNAGESAEVTATFTETETLSSVILSVTRADGSTGALNIIEVVSTTAPIDGTSFCFIGPVSGVPDSQLECKWTGVYVENAPRTGSVTVKLTASADASGSYQVQAIENPGQNKPVASLPVTVIAPPSTTAAPTTAAPTTAAPTTAAPTTTAAGSGGVAPTTTALPNTLPATGSSRATSAGLIGVILVSLGAAAVVLTRRRSGSATS